MTQARLRMIIFGLWLIFWIVSTALLMLAPWLRADQAVGPEQVKPAIFSITGIWVPVVTCLAAFWFPQDEQKRAQTVKAAGEKVAAALILTVAYLGFVLLLISWAIYFMPYDFQTKALPEGASFPEQISESVKIALIVSPIALAPVNWLTRSSRKSS
jgi:hypothetical protein